MGATLVVAAIVIAALVVRSALAELREPGSGRRQWMFLTDRRAVSAGAFTALALGLLGWRQAGTEGAVWAALAGILVAFVMGQGRRPQ
ncbi:hypothetical protein [Streptomyces vinaceus]|uniref:hypothetical protein n=1 Tax=Streptomyces vinaceus TaxID=1960 RepID=UPI001E47909F|nr:hypothetical protein [Streptomyces vinaceus]